MRPHRFVICLSDACSLDVFKAKGQLPVQDVSEEGGEIGSVLVSEKLGLKQGY